jgi:bifunctional DNA-binding transcriptional regulator/antitoxin component of YhaV-PrlF toxin-antitoxin module
MTRKEFRIKLERSGGAARFTLPFSVQEVFGSKARVPVKGAINGVPYRSSAFPMGDGKHYMVVNKSVRDAAGIEAGDTVRVTMEPDSEARVVVVPSDFKTALARNGEAKASFDLLSYSHKKEYVKWITETKKEETRARRIEKAIEMLPKRKTPMG